ncbi:ABC transporter ATP-binding protein [Paenibacillus riograndensis]|uniref:Putative ABC transporter ATP binding protein n=1 Tax=Paenibacillus riograndensis SBR5 TaxID=1073571 RepID=A0A0E4H9F6_9BACL|nr:ATP-binding cassette domain-containing protein [Paenibacillus riograndensis]CQR54602.1 putative ABC transporter ATP binding protein [Paenibacillus riograndensis SBR5]
MSAVFEIHNLAKFNWEAEAKGESRYLFSRISAEISKPERVALIGASGQGKSTLLRILALLDIPDQGDLLLNGASFKNSNPREWRMAVAYVAQQAVMLPGSIEDNLRTVSRLHGQPYDAALGAQLMEQLGLDHLDLAKKAEDCSGGEKQRISLIRTLLLRPSILLLDEATASLDIDSTRKVEALLLNRHKEEGITLIWVTHDPEQAHRISNRTWAMDKGGMREYSTASYFEQSLKGAVHP